MIKQIKWIGVLAAVLLIVSCFTPWVIIESKHITVSGIDSSGTNYGKPGYMHFIFTAIFLLLTFVKKVWAKRLNVPVAGINLAWAIRNYFVVTVCSAGECPAKQTGLWLLLATSLIMLLASLFPDIELKQDA